MHEKKVTKNKSRMGRFNARTIYFNACLGEVVRDKHISGFGGGTWPPGHHKTITD